MAVFTILGCCVLCCSAFACLSLEESETQKAVVEMLFEEALDISMVDYIQEKCRKVKMGLLTRQDSADSTGDAEDNEPSAVTYGSQDPDPTKTEERDDQQSTHSSEPVLYPGYKQSSHISGGFGQQAEATDSDCSNEAAQPGMPLNRIPPPPPFLSKHCPPLQSDTVFSAVCDCFQRHNKILCCVDGLCQEFLDSEMDKAKRMADSTKRLTNNLQRKRCYRKVASLLDYRIRRQLPACVLAKIRQTWPDSDGCYLGYCSY